MSPQHNKINIFIFISISGAPNTQKNSSQFSIHVSRNTHTKYDYVCYIHFQVNNWIGWTWIDVNIAPSWLEQLKWFQYIVFVLESLPLCSNCVRPEQRMRQIATRFANIPFICYCRTWSAKEWPKNHGMIFWKLLIYMFRTKNLFFSAGRQIFGYQRNTIERNERIANRHWKIISN